MHGVQLVELDIEDDSVQVKNETTDCAEILQPFEHTFLCTICAKTHSKNFSCVDYGVFKTEVFLCSNQKCGKIFESESDLGQHGNSCQVTTDPPITETATVENEVVCRPSQNKQCNDCQKKFASIKLYFRHMRIMHPAQIKCNVLRCIKFFKKQTDFEEHLLDHKNSVFCAICEKVFKSKLTIQRHILNQHLQQKNLNSKFARSVLGETECTYCGKFYKEVGAHVISKHPDKCVNCLTSGCRSVFLSEEAMTVHVHMFHVHTKCDICQKNFASNYRLEMHISKQHTYKKSRFKRGKTECCYCGKFQRNILDHIRTFHPKKLFKCTLSNCKGKIFSTAQSLCKHLRHFHSSDKCVHCNKVFETTSMYVRHVCSYHRSNGNIKCYLTTCNKFFKSLAEMEKHYTKNHPLQAKCDLCGFLFPSLNNIFQHMKKSHYPKFEKKKEKLANNNAGKIKCPYCKVFVKMINGHLKRRHPEKMVKCPETSCCKEFVTVVDLQNHMQKAHNSVKCIFCDKVYIGNLKYTQHVYRCHQGKNLFKCSYSGCIHCFQSQVEMENHYKERHPFQAKCDLCGYLAPSFIVLLQHMQGRHYPTFEKPKLKHNNREIGATETLPQSCTFCAKTIPLSQLKTHKNSICKKCEKPFPCKGVLAQHTPTCFFHCSVCKKQFKTNYKLKSHQVTHSKDWKGLEHQALGFKCDECRKYYSNKKQLKRHVYCVHRNRNKFKCDLCGKTFPHKSSVQAHMIGPHQFGTDEFKCKKCCKSFSRLSNLNTHNKSFHGGVIK